MTHFHSLLKDILLSILPTIELHKFFEPFLVFSVNETPGFWGMATQTTFGTAIFLKTFGLLLNLIHEFQGNLHPTQTPVPVLSNLMAQPLISHFENIHRPLLVSHELFYCIKLISQQDFGCGDGDCH